MKDFMNIFGRRYAAVSTNDSINERGDNCTGAISKTKQHKSKKHKSLQSKPAISGGLNILDSFFHKREAGKRARWPKCVFLFLVAGFCLIGTSFFIYIFQPYELIFKWKLILSDGGEIFNLWKTPPVDLFIRIYLFNITNHKEFLAGKEKLNVQEVGPYVYKEVLSHENITFNDNGTLSAIPKHPLVYQPHLSEGRTEDDILWLPNIALLSIAQVTAPKSYFLRLPINLVIRQTKSEPIVNMTAKEFMFGYPSPLTTLGNKLLPSWIHFDKVGLIDRMYDFEGDFETFFTGENDVKMSGLYDTFRGSTNLQHWEGERCSKIQGASDGTKFKSFISKTEKLTFFRKSMCRPISMVRSNNKSETMHGLEAYKYRFENNSLDNGLYDEQNKCFCREGYCLPHGLVDVTDCYYGFPIALSFPHFRDSNPELSTNVTGIKPNKTHDSYFFLNPVSGLPLNISVKFQINMAMRDVRNMAHVEKFSHLIVPMLWFEIGMTELPQSLTNRFILYLNILPVVEKIFLYGSMPLGVLLALFAVTKAALRISTNFGPSQKNTRYNRNISHNAVYNTCEEKLMHQKNEFPLPDESKYYKIADDDDNLDHLIIGRHDYELENDAALSDIDYNEQNDEEGFDDELDSDRSSQEMKLIKSHNSKNIPKNYSFSNASTASASGSGKNSSEFIEIDLSQDSRSATSSSLSSNSIHNLESSDSNRESLLQIVESDDDIDDSKERKQVARKYSLEGASGSSSLRNENGHRLSLGNESISIILDNIK